MNYLVIFVFSVCLNFGYAQNTTNKYTFTYKMASQCKEYISRHGYKYETFFSAESDGRKSPSDPDIMFEMHFAILAASNGHVLLSTIPEPTTSDPVYEFVIGGGGNKFTELRRMLRKNAKGSVITRGILSAVEFNAFYIKIYESGAVQFGREGDPLPLINYVDVDPIPIRYFSFASWKDEAKYLYDCPVALVTPTNSVEAEQNITGPEKLKKSLLETRSMNIPPAYAIDVSIGFIVNSVKYDAFTSKMITEFIMIVMWVDNSMAWNPQKFNGTKALSFRPSEIWKPLFVEASSPYEDRLDSVIESINANYTGLMSYGCANRYETWCDDTSMKLNRWPNDEYNCQLVVETWNTHEHIKLNAISIINIDTTSVKTVNGWDLKYGQQIVNRTLWNSLYASPEYDFTEDENTTSLSDRLVVNISLKRVGTAYNIVFYVPLVVLMSFVLMSFWSIPLTMSRVWFYAGTSTFISLGLSYVDYFVPCHSVPSVLILYTSVLAGTLLALVLNVALIQASEQKFYKSRYITTLLTAKMFRSVFCLPDLKSCQLYETIDEEFSQDGRSIAMEMMQDDDQVKGEREECAEVVDKILFTVYSVTFSVLLACHY